jgi:hypothetical protein
MVRWIFQVLLINHETVRKHIFNLTKHLKYNFIAMKLAEPGSCIFHFTDADAKDPELLPDVTELINNKSLHLMHFVRGNRSSPYAVHGGKSYHGTKFATLTPNVNCIGHNLSGIKIRS